MVQQGGYRAAVVALAVVASVATTAQARLRFGSVRTTTVNGAGLLATGNLDGSGGADVAVGNGTKIQTFRGTPSGLVLAGQVSVDPSTDPLYTAITIGDVNGDGKADLVAARLGSANDADIAIYAGNGDGTVNASPVVLPVPGDQALTVWVSDVNGDGKADIVDEALTGVVVLRGKGSGQFETPQSTIDSSFGGVVADITGDGKADAAVAHIDDQGYFVGVDVLAGNGDGTFASPFPLLGDDAILSLAADSAGRTFAVASDRTTRDRSLQLVLPGATPTVSSAPSALPAGGRAVAAGDLTGDGIADALVGSSVSTDAASGTFLVIPSSTDGSGLGTADSFALPDRVTSVALADVTGDGLLDLVGAASADKALMVLPNASGPEISPSPGTVDFGSQTVGTLSPSKAVVVTNTGPVPLHATAAHLSGTDADSFLVSSDECAGATVAPGASCTVRLRFAPAAAGAASAALQLNGDGIDGPQQVALTGAGATPAPPAGTGGSSQPAGSSTGSAQTAAPRISELRITPDVLHRKHRRVASLTYRDDAAATATLTVFRIVRGVRQGGSCQAAGHGRRGRACRRMVRVGTLSHADAAGLNRVRFNGAFNGVLLSLGRYRLTVAATNAAGTSRTVAAPFRMAH